MINKDTCKLYELYLASFSGAGPARTPARPGT